MLRPDLAALESIFAGAKDAILLTREASLCEGNYKAKIRMLPKQQQWSIRVMLNTSISTRTFTRRVREAPGTSVRGCRRTAGFLKRLRCADRAKGGRAGQMGQPPKRGPEWRVFIAVSPKSLGSCMSNLPVSPLGVGKSWFCWGFDDQPSSRLEVAWHLPVYEPLMRRERLAVAVARGC